MLKNINVFSAMEQYLSIIITEISLKQHNTPSVTFTCFMASLSLILVSPMHVLRYIFGLRVSFKEKIFIKATRYYNFYTSMRGSWQVNYYYYIYSLASILLSFASYFNQSIVSLLLYPYFSLSLLFLAHMYCGYCDNMNGLVSYPILSWKTLVLHSPP